MSARGAPSGYAPVATGLASLLLFFCVMEVVIRSGLVSRFIVPPPSEILESFERVIPRAGAGRNIRQHQPRSDDGSPATVHAHDPARTRL